MRILNQVPAQPKRQQIASVKTDDVQSKTGPDDRVIVKREKPTDISDSAIRAKIKAHKNDSDVKKAVEVKDDFVTAMPDDIELNQKSTLVRNEDKKVEPSEKKDISKVSPDVKNEVAKVATELKNEQKAEDVLLKSDIAKNDPTDSNTQEKLRSILKSGGFSFSQKEKDTLGKILNADS